ncbi:MAG: metal ABC transporter ATP-binding protein [Breznakia sp.]
MPIYCKQTLPTSNKPWIINVQDISVSFDGYLALKDLSFSIQQGDYVYLLGPNGSGKTTLVRLLCGLQKQTYGAYETKSNHIGYLPQKLMGKTVFPITVEEVIYSGFRKQQFVISKDIKRQIRKWLKKMGIEQLVHKPIGVLSGGQQQRVFLIRALICEPEILILDEPTSALDPKFREVFNVYIDTLHKQGTTIIYVTHDLDNLHQKQKKVMYVDQEIRFYGTIEAYQDFIKEGDRHV